MAGNSFGRIFKLTTFGESHGSALGGIIDGVPAGFHVDLEAIQMELDRRKPGQSKIVTQRKESDSVELLSGVFEGKTTGTPIGFLIKNEDAKSKDYSHLKDNYRPSHADFTYDQKYGFRDYRGGGRASARETACRVVAGALAKQFLRTLNIEIHAFVDQVGPIQMDRHEPINFGQIEDTVVRCPNPELAKEMIAYIEDIKKAGDTIGGSIRCLALNVPAGLGEPVFDKLHADLGKAMLSINAVKGFEIGSGFQSITMKGSEHNDLFIENHQTASNHSGGIQGGISNGQTIDFRVAFKPVATIIQKQKSINKAGEEIELEGKGRHDPCVVPRAVPIVEAMCAMVLFDNWLLNKSRRWQ
jgi:chorismate synthase